MNSGGGRAIGGDGLGSKQTYIGPLKFTPSSIPAVFTGASNDAGVAPWDPVASGTILAGVRLGVFTGFEVVLAVLPSPA